MPSIGSGRHPCWMQALRSGLFLIRSITGHRRHWATALAPRGMVRLGPAPAVAVRPCWCQTLVSESSARPVLARGLGRGHHDSASKNNLITSTKIHMENPRQASHRPHRIQRASRRICMRRSSSLLALSSAGFAATRQQWASPCSTSLEDAVCGSRLTWPCTDLGRNAIGAAVPRESPLRPVGSGTQRARLRRACEPTSRCWHRGQMSEAADRMARSALHRAATLGDFAGVQSALAAGDDPNALDSAGWTPLHFAAQAQSPEVASALLLAGAAVDTKDDHGNTPLWRAVFNYRGDPRVLLVLRDSGADPDRANAHGVSARQLAGRIANYDVATHLTW